MTYTILKQTEKALFVSIPYWLETNNSKSAHQQKELTLWLPKSQAGNGSIPQWIIDNALQALKRQNQYINIDSIKKHLGETAPQKQRVEEWVSDENARREYEKQWIKSLPSKYQNARFPIDSYYKIDEMGTEEELNFHKQKMDSLKTKVVYYL